MIVAMKSHKPALRRAIKIVGGQRKLARELTEELGKKSPGRKITQSHVWGWLNEAKKFPPEICAPIEIVTSRYEGGPVRAGEFRSDLFGLT